MEYVPGQRLADCWDEMGVPQRTRVAKDLARVMAEMFALTASHCGSLLRDLSLDDSKRSLRYEPSAVNASVVDASIMDTLEVDAPDEAHTKVVDGDFLIGPVNDLSFLTVNKIVPASLCGPFVTERAFLEAFGYRNEFGGTKVLSRSNRWPIERMFEIYDVIRPLYEPPADSSAPFHFAHADLSVANLIVNPESGKIAGLIDWEMAGFRPAWLCATSGTWFNDDMCRFVMEDHQDGPEGYGDETDIDTALRQAFLAELKTHNPTLLEHNRQGVELRAMFHNLCNEYTANTTIWIVEYETHEWDVTRRGQFPFDVQKWAHEDLLDLFEK